MLIRCIDIISHFPATPERIISVMIRECHLLDLEYSAISSKSLAEEEFDFKGRVEIWNYIDVALCCAWLRAVKYLLAVRFIQNSCFS